VLGVSADTPEKQKKFKEKYDLNFTLLADTDRSVCQSYQVLKEKQMYGKTSIGIERTTFLIDREGKIARIFPKVKAEGHAEEVLTALRGLSSAAAD
jgi:peroxiredoxin Q/BCP